jgi:hypothetical protein
MLIGNPKEEEVMTETTIKVFEYLIDREGFVPAIDLAKALGYKNERPLRAIGTTIGVLDRASREIFEDRGLVLITRMREPSGVKLSKDPEEIAAAKEQWVKWFWPIKKNKIDFYERCERTLRSKQMELAV